MKAIIIIMAISLNNLYSQTQIGSSFITVNENEWIGWNVDISKDGTILAISSIAYPNYDNPDGKVKVYRRNSDQWEQVGEDIVVQDANNSFGYSISLSENGQILAVGIPSHDEPFNGCGAVKTYSITETSVIPSSGIIQGEESSEGIGFSIDLSHEGKTIVVGSQAPEYASVKIFEEQNGEWILKGSPILSDVYGDKFGYKVMIDSAGSTITAISPSLGVLNGELPNIKIFKYDDDDWQINEDIITSNDFDNAVENLTLNDNGNLIAAKHKNGILGKISFYEIQNNQLEQRADMIPGEENFYLLDGRISFGNNGNLIAVEGSNKIRFFEYNNNEWLDKNITIESEKIIHDQKISEDGNYIIVSISGIDYSEREVSVYQLDGLNSIFEKPVTDLEFYPNPVSSKLVLNLRGIEYAIFEIKSGQVLKTGYSENGEINVTDLNLGTYILSIKKKNKTQILKFVIIK